MKRFESDWGSTYFATHFRDLIALDYDAEEVFTPKRL